VTNVIIGLDPGDTTGVAVLGEDGTVYSLAQYSLADFTDWVVNFTLPDGFTVVRIVYERFVVFRQKAQKQVGSKMGASQSIGMIKVLAAKLNVPLTEQGSDIKTIALRWSGIKMPSAHSQSHQYDGYLHAYYWLKKNGYPVVRHRDA
jgi:hypothetical protein